MFAYCVSCLVGAATASCRDWDWIYFLPVSRRSQRSLRVDCGDSSAFVRSIQWAIQWIFALVDFMGGSWVIAHFFAEGRSASHLLPEFGFKFCCWMAGTWTCVTTGPFDSVFDSSETNREPFLIAVLRPPRCCDLHCDGKFDFVTFCARYSSFSHMAWRDPLVAHFADRQRPSAHVLTKSLRSMRRRKKIPWCAKPPGGPWDGGLIDLMKRHWTVKQRMVSVWPCVSLIELQNYMPQSHRIIAVKVRVWARSSGRPLTTCAAVSRFPTEEQASDAVERIWRIDQIREYCRADLCPAIDSVHRRLFMDQIHSIERRRDWGFTERCRNGAREQSFSAQGTRKAPFSRHSKSLRK